jgi:RNA polymerase sigma-70 factor (ECF subfamily)
LIPSTAIIIRGSDSFLSSEYKFMATNEELLRSARDFLRCQVERLAPDSPLHYAWDEFFSTYSVMIRNFIVAQGLRGADVDDCSQEVWMEVMRRLPDFERAEGRPGLRAWLYTVVRSKATDLVRSRLRRPANSLDLAAKEGLEPLDTQPDVACMFEKQWEHSLLQTLLEDLSRELPDANRRLLQMRFIDGRDVAEVARELGLTSAEVWYRQHRLLKKLRNRAAWFSGEPIGAVSQKRERGQIE